jgi:hypothetical protein
MVQGFLVSDWGAVNQLPQSTDAERLYQSINAGVDMIMMGDKEPFQETIKNLIAGVKTGRVSDGRINDAVKRILRAKVSSILPHCDGVLALMLNLLWKWCYQSLVSACLFVLSRCCVDQS